MPPYPPYMRKPLTDGLEKPKKLCEVPGYLWKRVKGFFFRLFYIVGLVYESSPAILFLMMFFCILDGVLPIIGAIISKDLLNAVADLLGLGLSATGDLKNDLFVTLRPLIFLLTLTFVHKLLSRVLNRVSSMTTSLAGELVVNHIKLKISRKALTVDLRSFDNPEFYEKLENANREANMRPISILTATFNVISTVISTVSFIAILTALSPYAPLIVIIAAIPGALVNYIYRNRNFHYIRFHSKERRQMNYYAGAVVNKDQAKEIKILGLGETFVDKYQTVFGKYYAGLRKLIVKEGVTQLLVGIISMLANCALFAYVGYNVIFGNGQIGDYSLYTGALNSITTYVTTLIASTATIYEGTLFIDNMITFMKEEPTVVPSLPEPRKPARGEPHTVEFRDVSFRYPGTSRDVISHVNLTFRPGEQIVLVGLNGAGKTTLIKLFTRLYDPTEGAIYLDGHDLREYDTAALYDMFGIIFQDFGKYAESVEENIRFGDVSREYAHENVVAAAVEGNAAPFIEELPHGYETPLTRMFEEDGIELSGGQWQKLSIARAFYKDSDILILDEPTAALDPMAEQEVFNQFSELAQGKITLFVSHRLSSAVTATKIVVLDGGKVAEVGTHEELMAEKGKYFTLFSTQASRYTGIDYNDPNDDFARRFHAEATLAEGESMPHRRGGARPPKREDEPRDDFSGGF